MFSGLARPGQPISPFGRVVFLVIVCFYVRALFEQASTLSFPIHDEHHHRQADTFSVAWHFVKEGYTPLHPKVQWGNENSGVMGMETPVLQTLMLPLMHLSPAPWAGRTVVFLFGILGTMAMFSLLLRKSTFAAFGLLLAIALSPMALFELRQVQPDGLVAGLGAISALLFVRSGEAPRSYGRFLIAMGVFSVTLLTKQSAVVYGPAMVVFAWCEGPLRRNILRSVSFIFPLLLLVAWMLWAKHLNETFDGGRTYFSMDFDLRRMLSDLRSFDHLRHLYTYLLPAYVSNWALWPFVLVGLTETLRRPSRQLGLGLLVWIGTGVLFLSLFSSRLHHWYYADILLFPIAALTAIGIGAAIERIMGGKKSAFVFAGLFAASFGGIVAGVPQRLGAAVASSGPNDRHSWMNDYTLVILLLLLALGLLIDSCVRRKVQWAGLLGLICTFTLLPRAWFDAKESLSFRSHREEIPGYLRDYLVPLRAAIDVASTAEDRFVVDTGTPATLWEIQRKGWVRFEHECTQEALRTWKTQGAKFYLHLGETRPFSAVPIASGNRWSLFRMEAIVR